MLKNFETIRALVQKREQRSRLGVVEAQDRHTLEAVHQAWKQELMEPVLYGKADEIERIWKEIAPGSPLPHVVPCHTKGESVARAIADVRAGGLECIMKGNVETGVLMKGVVNNQTGICQSKVLSLVGLFESPYYHKVFGITDVGLLIHPDLTQKKALVENAVNLFHLLGVEHPKVAILAAIEYVNQKMPETLDAQALKQMNEEGMITGCTIEGPISYDLCMDQDSAKIKEFKSEVAGDADILVVPEIVAGNLLSKGVEFTGGASTCGIVCGASVPIALVSRAARMEEKLMSIVLASAVGQAMAQGR